MMDDLYQSPSFLSNLIKDEPEVEMLGNILLYICVSQRFGVIEFIKKI
jgi:hypothetical protein